MKFVFIEGMEQNQRREMQVMRGSGGRFTPVQNPQSPQWRGSVFPSARQGSGMVAGPVD